MTWNRFTTWVGENRRLLLDLVRIYLGIGLLIKGIFYLQNPALTGVVGAPGWMAGAAQWAPYVHIVGGLLLALGVFTRLAALVQMPVVFGALFYLHLPRMGQSMQAREAVEFSALVLFLLAIIVVAGPGPLSVADRIGLRQDFAPARFREWAKMHPDLFMDAIRIYLGLGLIIKGLYIMNNQEQFTRFLEGNAMPMGLLTVAHYVIPAHFAGGVMLLLGFGTRIAAVIQLPLLIGALLYIYLPSFSSLELRQDMEFSALVLFLLALIAVHGPGRYSVDYVVQRNYFAHHPEEAAAGAQA
jgi:putative oxidoreductase